MSEKHDKKDKSTHLPGGCIVKGCKHAPEKQSFCSEHFEHFKFGIVKVDGTLAMDAEKKLDHFHRHKMKKTKKPA